MPMRIAPVSSKRSTSLTNTECTRVGRPGSRLGIAASGSGLGILASGSGLGIVASDEAVARAADGADERRLLGVVAELLAQPGDQHVDRAVVRLPVEAARGLENAVAGEDAAAILDQQAEQGELRRGERQVVGVEAGGARRPVHFD